MGTDIIDYKNFRSHAFVATSPTSQALRAKLPRLNIPAQHPHLVRNERRERERERRGKERKEEKRLERIKEEGGKSSVGIVFLFTYFLLFLF
jgi:hypothetical protein